MKKPELVLIPAPGIGHLVSMAEFAKRLINRDGRLSITLLVIRCNFTPEVHAYAESLAASSDPRIRYIALPLVDHPSEELLRCPENYVTLLIESLKTHVKDAIFEHVLSCSRPLAGMVVDFFCTSMIDVANELNVPSYLFFTSSAGFLGFLLHVPEHYKRKGKVFELSDPDSDVSGYANPVPSSVLPGCVLDTEGYATFMKHGARFKETEGVIINTFAELEPHALQDLTSDEEMPPIYAVGPLLDLNNGRKGSVSERERIMRWLDHQPPSSVVFLCFGSMGGFDPPQHQQIAIALERTGCRFLWSIRQPRVKSIAGYKHGFSELVETLPPGFSERTQDRGMLCGWAPQVDVLAHESVGGFVSHCGWNSILESLWHGVPIATWPIYAEQQLNAFEMVRELGLAVELRLDYRVGSEGIVGADEIEKAVRRLMDGENGVRKRVEEMGEESREAVSEGGSSFDSVGRFVDEALGNTRAKTKPRGR